MGRTVLANLPGVTCSPEISSILNRPGIVGGCLV